jgi:hypothetical protein
MRRLIDKMKPTPATGIGARVMQLGLHKTDEYINDIVTEEYNFQRESLYTPQIPPQLIAGSLLVAALAGFISTHNSKYTGPNSQYLVIIASLFLVLRCLVWAETFYAGSCRSSFPASR